MKIGKFQTSDLFKSIRKDETKKIDKKSSKSESGIKIEISSSAMELVNRVNQSEDKKHIERVEEIKKLISEGSYNVDPMKLAERIMTEIKEEKGSVD